MASIKVTYDKDNKPRWRVRVHVLGAVVTETFRTSLADAEAWAEATTRELEANRRLPVDEAVPIYPTMQELLDFFLEESPEWDSCVIEAARTLNHLTVDAITPDLILATWPKLGAVCVFLEHAIEFGRANMAVSLDQNPVAAARARLDKLPFRPISENEREILIRWAEQANSHEYLPSLLSIIMDGGLKQKDALELRRQDVHLASNSLQIGERQIPLRASTTQLLRKHMTKVEGDQLYAGVSMQAATGRLARYCAQLGLANITFTDMRQDAVYRMAMRLGFERTFAIEGRKSRNNTEWLIASVERNRRVLDGMTYKPRWPI